MNDAPVSPEGQALHEAGHVVFGVMAGKRLRCVEIRLGAQQATGCTTWEPDLEQTGTLTLEQIKPHCLVLLAGHETQLRLRPDSLTCYHSNYNDLAQVTMLFRRVSPGAEAAHKDSWIEEVRARLRDANVQSTIIAVAEALLHSSRLEGEQATRIVQENLGQVAS